MADFIDRLTLYDILDLDPAATGDAIRAAIRGKRVAFHPDHARGAADHDLRQRWSKRIGEAELVLLDPARRAAYDAALRASARDEPVSGEPPTGPGASSDAEDRNERESHSSPPPPPPPPPPRPKRTAPSANLRRIARTGWAIGVTRMPPLRGVRVRQQVKPKTAAWLAVGGCIMASWLATTNLLFQFLVKVGWLPLYLVSSLLRAVFGSGDFVVFVSTAPVLLGGVALLGGAARWQAFVASRTGFGARRRSGNVVWLLFCIAPLWAWAGAWWLSRLASGSRQA